MIDEKTGAKILAGLLVISIITGIVLLSLLPPAANKGKMEKTGEFINNSAYPADSIAVLNIFTPITYSDGNDYFGMSRGGAIYWVDLLKSAETIRTSRRLF